jgi:hypothetical protein
MLRFLVLSAMGALQQQQTVNASKPSAAPPHGFRQRGTLKMKAAGAPSWCVRYTICGNIGSNGNFTSECEHLKFLRCGLLSHRSRTGHPNELPNLGEAC